MTEVWCSLQTQPAFLHVHIGVGTAMVRLLGSAWLQPPWPDTLAMCRHRGAAPSPSGPAVSLPKEVCFGMDALRVPPCSHLSPPRALLRDTPICFDI